MLLHIEIPGFISEASAFSFILQISFLFLAKSQPSCSSPVPRPSDRCTRSVVFISRYSRDRASKPRRKPQQTI